MGLKDRFAGAKEARQQDDIGVASGAEVVVNPKEELRAFRKQHKWDPFLDIDKLDTVDAALASGNAEKEAAVEESLIEENSPYPEVRASVRAASSIAS